ncbi:MAG: thioredoxin family protein, partial [Deltaproteobacteria bacterium]|nr:thioredoxin family protein [Deltaproteobacteria bacterium]
VIPQLKSYEFNQGLQFAKERDKFIILHFFSDNCIHCRVFKTQVLTDPSVIKALNNSFVFIPLDTMLQPELGEYFKISIVPTEYFLDSQGNTITQYFGGMSVERFLYVLSYFTNGTYKKNESLNEYVTRKGKSI